MSYIIVGLGNPGDEYINTRHNTGRIMLDAFAKENDFPELTLDKKTKALVSEGKVGKEKVLLVEPETFMNKSGETLKQIKDLKFKVIGKGKEKRIEVGNLVVIHDDLDIPFGKFKISFNKSSGGHRGVESVNKVLKTEGYIRVRVGISSASPKGGVKKPHGEEMINKFILGKFKPVELEELKKIAKKGSEALSFIMEEGVGATMGKYNSM